MAYNDGEYVVSSPLTFMANCMKQVMAILGCWWESGEKTVRLRMRLQYFLYFHTGGTTTPMCENEQMYKCQAENLILPLMEWYLLVSSGDKSSLWHKITSLIAYRTELNAAPVPDFLPTVDISVFLTSGLGRKQQSSFLSEKILKDIALILRNFM